MTFQSNIIIIFFLIWIKFYLYTTAAMEVFWKELYQFKNVHCKYNMEPNKYCFLLLYHQVHTILQYHWVGLSYSSEVWNFYKQLCLKLAVLGDLQSFINTYIVSKYNSTTIILKISKSELPCIFYARFDAFCSHGSLLNVENYFTIQ